MTRNDEEMVKKKLNLAERLNTESWTVLQEIYSEIFAAGESAIPELIEAYDKVSFWEGRKIIIYSLVLYGYTHKEVYELGIRALKDKSAKVRDEANILLARADSKKAIDNFKAKGETCPDWGYNVKKQDQ